MLSRVGYDCVGKEDDGGGHCWAYAVSVVFVAGWVRREKVGLEVA